MTWSPFVKKQNTLSTLKFSSQKLVPRLTQLKGMQVRLKLSTQSSVYFASHVHASTVLLYHNIIRPGSPLHPSLMCIFPSLTVFDSFYVAFCVSLVFVSLFRSYRLMFPQRLPGSSQHTCACDPEPHRKFCFCRQEKEHCAGVC